jgi:hypothetical protein
LACLFAVSGCTTTNVSTATVSGRVTRGGTAVSAGTVLLMTEGGQAASAELKPDGTYTIHCQPNHFRVAVAPPPAVDPLTDAKDTVQGAAAGQPPIPKRYHDFGTSGLSVEVKPGSNTFDIALSN